MESNQKPWEHRICRECGKRFQRSHNSLSTRYCTTCSKERRKGRHQKKVNKNKRGVAATYHGFGKAMPKTSPEGASCGVCNLSNKEHKKKFKTGLHRDHIIPARRAEQWGDAHNERNLMWLCFDCHGTKTRLEKYFFRAWYLDFFNGLKKHNWPIDKVIDAVLLFGFSPERFQLVEAKK